MKRLYFLFTLIFTAALLLSTGTQPVQAVSGTNGMSIIQTGITARLDVFSSYLAAIHYGVGFDEAEPEAVVDHQMEDFISAVSTGGTKITETFQ